jgi:hypothetical protein
MAKTKAKPASERVEVVWLPNGAIARPLKEDVQKWLDKGWQLVEPATPAASEEEAPTKETDQ